MQLCGSGSIAASGELEFNADDYIIEARMKQNDCTAAKNGAFSMAVGVDEENSVFDRFVFADVDQSMRDRLMLGYSDENDNAAFWHKIVVSDETGQLNKTAHTTEYFNLTAKKIDGLLSLEQGDKKIAANSEISATASGKGGNCMKLTAHSVDVSIDSLKITELAEATALQIQTETAPKAGQVCDFQILGVNEGKNYRLSPETYQLTWDSEAVMIENERITFKKAGETVVKVQTKSIDGKKLTASLKICVGEADREIKLILPESVLLGSVNEYKIVNSANEEIACDRIECDTLDFGKKSFYAGTPGDHKVKVWYGDSTAEGTIHVSEYEGMELVADKTDIQPGDRLTFTLWGVKSGVREKSLDYGSLIYDSTKVESGDGYVSLKGYGKTTIAAIYDGIKTSTEIIAHQPEKGEVFSENFEGEKVFDGFAYDLTKVAQKGGSRALLLEDERVDVDTEDASNYEVSGKFFVAAKDDTAFLPYFGIELHSGNKPVLCSVSDCLRIASVSGDETVSVMNGNWHSFCVKVLDRAVEFTVDNITRTGYGDYNTSGDFAFVSGGMKVYLDDITYTRLALPSGVPEKIAPSNKTIQLCKYGKYAVEEINGIKAINSDGTYRYVSDYNTLSRRIVSGMKYAEISGGVISFSKDAPENCLVRIEAKYAGKTCTYDIRLTDSGMTQAEYIKSTVDRRRGDFAMYLARQAVRNPDLSDIGGLAAIYADMILNPKSRDYTDIVRWHIRQAIYGEKINGDANGAGDFALLQAIRCYYQLRGKVRAEQKAFDEIKNYLNQVSYPAKNVALSENPRLVFDVCEQLGAEITGRSTDAEEHLIAYFTEKLNNGFMEVQSPHYMVVDLYALETLWQFTENARLKQAAFDMAALIYGMQLTDSTDGMIAGACVREYAAFGKTMTYLPSALMFGEGILLTRITLSVIYSFQELSFPDICRRTFCSILRRIGHIRMSIRRKAGYIASRLMKILRRHLYGTVI